ncbi:MAG: hypothetical protein IJZ03_02190 [Clostridia bacterium]|nr:hypothetical protein [Clostridia bacterium]MBQ9129546.1 hypothetical protein [Clostridia bacterium]
MTFIHIKRALCILLASLSIFALCACGDMTTTDEKQDKPTEDARPDERPKESPKDSPDRSPSPSPILPLPSLPSLPETLPNLTPDNNSPSDDLSAENKD